MDNRAFSRVVLLVLVVAVGLLAWQARGGSGQMAPSPTVVAVVTVSSVLPALNENKDVLAVQMARFEDYKKQLEKANNELLIAQDNMNQAEKAGDATLNAKRLAAVEAEALFQARNAALQKIVDIEAGEEASKLYGKIVAAAKTIAEEQGIDLVLLDDQSIQPREEAAIDAVRGVIRMRKVLYANPRLDITKQIIDRMNNDYDAANKGRQ